jgi:hypothetical protein
VRLLIRHGAQSTRRGPAAASPGYSRKVPLREDIRNVAIVAHVDLDAEESQIEFPIVYSNARAGEAGFAPEELTPDLEPLFETLAAHIPAPSYTEGHPLQALEAKAPEDAEAYRAFVVEVAESVGSAAGGGETAETATLEKIKSAVNGG